MPEVERNPVWDALDWDSIRSSSPKHLEICRQLRTRTGFAYLSESALSALFEQWRDECSIGLKSFRGAITSTNSALPFIQMLRPIGWSNHNRIYRVRDFLRLVLKRTKQQRAKDSSERVYFVQAVCGGPVKIGKTTKPMSERLSALQTGSPVPLKVLAVRKASERRLHQKFFEYRLSGEWFRPEGALLDYLRLIGAQPMSPRQADAHMATAMASHCIESMSTWMDSAKRNLAEARENSAKAMTMARQLSEHVDMVELCLSDIEEGFRHSLERTWTPFQSSREKESVA